MNALEPRRLIKPKQELLMRIVLAVIALVCSTASVWAEDSFWDLGLGGELYAIRNFQDHRSMRIIACHPNDQAFTIARYMDDGYNTGMAYTFRVTVGDSFLIYSREDGQATKAELISFKNCYGRFKM